MAEPRQDQGTTAKDGTATLTEAEAHVQQAREEHGPALAGAGIGLVALVVALTVVRRRRA